MVSFLYGILASMIGAILMKIIAKWAWPAFKDRIIYDGIRVAGPWTISEVRKGQSVTAGRIELKQKGRLITGTSTRIKTREGKDSERKFHYHGFITGQQLTLIFEDANGLGFDTGTYVFIVQNDKKTMIGMATFHGRRENKIVSESRTLIKEVS